MFSSPASTLCDESPTSSTSTLASPPSSSTVHYASLVDPANHSPALMELVGIKLSRPLVEYVVDCVAETVDYALGRAPADLPSRGRTPTRSPSQAQFGNFVANILVRAEVAPPTLLTALVYVARARPHLSIALEEWALERVFLGALIAASKYTQDSTLKNIHWALCTGVFGKGDIGRIEREFFDVLDWELRVSEADLLAHHAGLSAVLGLGRELELEAQQPQRSRKPRVSGVPALEPASPMSSMESMSPRTPASHPASPPHPAADLSPLPPAAADVSVPVYVHPAIAAPQKKGRTLHALMRAFHCPHTHRRLSMQVMA
ncbi:hypothetical protein B0H15DRAFT_889951 [Mycena belliarum]|uniref:Cyclin N-terminal domain-containing protein n=1 Tax=Mycena belliarum TaxID=1033014 RepID=A0AAD6TY98_9AGAR|nr:hypothetical protein B0H15DRAFT_889951 [Mycena belliae]